MKTSQRILSAELWLLAMIVYIDGWTWIREHRAGCLLVFHRELNTGVWS